MYVMNEKIKTSLIMTTALFMLTFDITVVITILPIVATTLQIDPIQFKFIISAYLLSIGLFLSFSYWLVSRVGDRSMFLKSIILFVLGSAVCGFSEGIASLILGRIIQAFGGAGMIASGTSILLNLYKHSTRSKMASDLVFYATLGPVIGPLVGGTIVSALSWHMVFFINIPLGMILLFYALKVLPDNAPEKKIKFDWLSYCFFIVAVSSIFTLLDSSGFNFTSVLTVLLVGFVSSYLLNYQLKRCSNPMFNKKLFAQFAFIKYLLISNAMRVIIGGFFFTTIMFLQLGMQLPPMKLGIVLFFFALGSILARGLMKSFDLKLDDNWQLITCGIMLSFAIFLTSYITFFVPIYCIASLMMVQGFLVTLFSKHINHRMFETIRSNQLYDATKVYTVFQFVSWSIGVTMASALIDYLKGGIVTVYDVPPVSFEQMYIILAVLMFIICLSIKYFADSKREKYH